MREREVKNDKMALRIHHETSTPSPQLPALAALFEQAKAAKLKALVVTHAATSEVERSIAKRRHDLRAALRTIGFTVEALQTGYTFQDDKAAAKIEAIAKAAAILEREGDILTTLLAGD